MQRIIAVVAFFLLFVVPAALADNLPNANDDPAYRALRNPTLSGETVFLENYELKRDAGTFTLTGTVCFVAPVEGKVTGAVFSGNGKFHMRPPLAVERTSLSRLTKQPEINEEFEQLVLRFTDSTYDELQRAGKPGKSACSPDLLNDIGHALRKDLQWNLAARLLQDVYGKWPGGLFAAFIKGQKYEGKELYLIDPRGTMDFGCAPEEVLLLTWNANKGGIWTSFHLAPEYAGGKASSAEQNAALRIEKQQIDVTIEKGGRLSGKATTTFIPQLDQLRALRFNLFPKLRVASVTDEAGTALKFIQEDKDEDADFWVILPKPLAAGAKSAIVTNYSGKDALQNEGNGNYYLAGGARDSWYPGTGGLGAYTIYDMRFTYPKAMKLLASGTLIKEVTEGGQKVAEWRSEQPQTVAGFHLGKFRKDEKIVKNMVLETYANEEVPDFVRGLQQTVDQLENKYGHGSTETTLGSISTLGMMKKAMAEAELATQLYADYFGPTPFKRLAMTQQTASNYGQSWPELVWLPISYFFDDTIRHQLYGFDPRGYFKVVGPHEIAHQWWGHTVTWASYRDQWMSEGFSETSASIFLQMLEKSPTRFIKFWNDERDLLLERNKEGFRAIDAGPVTLGYRINNSRWAASPKG